jgi:hypothetical protein
MWSHRRIGHQTLSFFLWIRPETVVIVVLTDDKENASETPQDVVRDRVDEHQAEHDWGIPLQRSEPRRSPHR